MILHKASIQRHVCLIVIPSSLACFAFCGIWQNGILSIRVQTVKQLDSSSRVVFIYSKVHKIKLMQIGEFMH